MKASAADRSTQELITDLDKQIPALIAEAQVPGLSMCLIRGADVAWSQVFGASSRKTREPVTPDTVFEAASLSKPVFAYASLKLCDAGMLDLDTPLDEYLPEPFVPDEPRLKYITLRHVLCHTTGFPNWRPKGKALRIYFTPGERFSYSGEGYMYLQAVVSHITKQEPAAYMLSNLLNQLGMVKSHFTWTDESGLPKAAGHDAKGKPKKKNPWPKMVAAASLHCTPVDFGWFMCAVMRPSAKNPSHLGPEMTAEMLTPQVQVNDSAPWQKGWPRSDFKTSDRVSWGLGWGLQQTSSSDSIWHWGDNGNYRCFAVGYPERGDGIVIMTNGANGQVVINHILREIVGGEYPGLDWLESL